MTSAIFFLIQRNSEELKLGKISKQITLKQILANNLSFFPIVLKS